MYHPINRINCSTLGKLNDLLLLTLNFCLRQSKVLSEDEIKRRFILYFAINGYPNAGEWLWKKRVVIKPRVMQLVTKPLGQKEGILSAFLDDQDLDARFQEGCFHAARISAGSIQALAIVNDLVEDFYTEILAGDGVPGDKIGETEPLDRQTVLRAYLACQHPLRLKVCPGCDGHPPSVADGKVREDLDHVFPKSRHKFLSIHPLNLTPLCKNCNQTYKQSKDAIIDNDPVVVDVHTLHDIYHPYLAPAKGQIEIAVESNANLEPHFTFRPIANTPQENARLHSLQYLLNLEARWDGELQQERLQEQLEIFILHGSQEDRDANIQPDMAWLERKLSAAAESFRQGVGRIPEYVPALAYTDWVTRTPQEKSKWLTITQHAFAQ